MIAAHHIDQVHYTPKAELVPYVSSYCCYHFGLQLQQTTLFFLPEGIVEIIFQRDAGMRYTHPITGEWLDRECAFVGGLHTRAYRIKVGKARQAFGIRFRAGTFAYFTSFPVHELKNQLLNPALLWGQAGQDWQEKMTSATTTAQQVSLANQFLVSQFKACLPFPVNALLALIQQKEGHCKVTELARIACLSDAQFRLRFNAHFGVSPKTYLRLYRLEQLKKIGQPQMSMRDLAFQLGYYDPSHFNKEVKLITGLSPTRFCKAFI